MAWKDDFPGCRFVFPFALWCTVADDGATQVQRVKEANDIVDVIGSYLSLRPAGALFKGLCPFHEDHNPSFTVDPRRQTFRCWACSKYGDVIDFVQEQERVTFREALELLARRAGISLEKGSSSRHEKTRASMLEVMRWAAGQFQECLLESPQAEAARVYLGERKITGDTVRRFGLGFAPPLGEWLTQRAGQAGLPADVLETLGLIAKRNEGNGYYDRFRDRVMFPIRDGRGQPVGFGGRILPTSASLKRENPPPKYYNSAETVLFSKSNQLYGIDQARQAALDEGYLAVVEGYTDVLMAHQMGMTHVVATMGTALNERHVQQLRRLVPRVVLVFDADAGGEGGVDRAMDVFVKNDLELQVASLPDGLDPCDLLVQKGVEPFRSALTKAVDVLEFKLNRVWAHEGPGVEGRRRAIDAVLGILAQAPETRSVKMELMVNRIAGRAGLKEETVWSRLKELRGTARDRPGTQGQGSPAPEQPQEARQGPAAPFEVELVEVLLAEPALATKARAELDPACIEHPGLRRLVEGLFLLVEEGLTPDLDHLRPRIDNPALLAKARQWLDKGTANPDRQATLQDVLTRFRQRQAVSLKRELQNQVQSADHAQAVELLRKRMKI